MDKEYTVYLTEADINKVLTAIGNHFSFVDCYELINNIKTQVQAQMPPPDVV